MNAIRRLGELRAVEAIPDLISLLGFRYTHRREREGGPRVVRARDFSRYPAADALAEIGNPALPSLVEVVETREFDSMESRNARYAIRLIFRYEPEKADEFFQNAAAKAPSAKAAERLRKALKTTQQEMESSSSDRGG